MIERLSFDDKLKLLLQILSEIEPSNFPRPPAGIRWVVDIGPSVLNPQDFTVTRAVVVNGRLVGHADVTPKASPKIEELLKGKSDGKD